MADTRNDTGDLGGPFLTGNQERDFPVLESTCIPSGVTPAAYSFNFTAVPHPAGQRLGFLTTWPQGQAQPTVSTLNNPTGTIVANAAIVPAGTNGGIAVFPNNDTDLVIDINGYFAAPGQGGLSLYTLTPCRVLDTRDAGGAFNGELTVDVAGSACSVPGSAQAFVFNATVIPPGSLGYLTLWPDGEDRPVASTLNAIDGAIASNMALVPTTNGSIDAFASATTQLLLDISSYLAPLPPLTITTTSLPGGTTGQPYQQVMAATGGEPPYSWSVSSGNLPTGLTLSAGGTVSGIPTSSGDYSFTVQVSDTLSNTTTADLSITVQAGSLLVTTMVLPDGLPGVPYNATMGVSGGTAPFTWSIVSGALPDGLSLHAGSGVISGTPTTTGTSNFTVQVEDADSHTAEAALGITVDPAITTGTLSGHYAFSFEGYNNGSPVIMAGAFIADGNGNLTSGFLDRNDGSGEPSNGSTHRVTPETIGTGSVYALAANGQGTMTIVTNKGTYDFSIAVSATGCVANASLSTCGRLIQSDAQAYGSGTLKVQDPSSFPLHQIFPGNFALLYWGTDPSNHRYAGAGALGTNARTYVDIDCSSSPGGSGWGLDGCPSEANDNGQTFYESMKGSFSATIDANTGRGDFISLTFANDPGVCKTPGSACSFVYYIVNHNELIFISTDPIAKPANLTLWSALRQYAPDGGWGASSLQGASVVELNAVDPNGGNPLADVTAGLLVSDGAGNVTFNSDENKGGTLNLQQPSAGTYTIDNHTGKVTLSGLAQFGTTQPLLYMVAPNTAVVVGTDAEVTSGVVEAQSGSPYSNASLIGTYAGGSSWPALAAVTNSVTALFADGSGNIGASQYTSGPGGDGGPNQLALTYSVDSTGRAVVQQGGNPFGILYVVSPNKAVLLPLDSTPTLNIFASGPSN